jgi:hypothetical protein
MTARTVTPRVLLGLVIAGAALWLLIDRDRLDPALLETAVRDLGPWAPLAHIALFALATPAVRFSVRCGGQRSTWSALRWARPRPSSSDVILRGNG